MCMCVSREDRKCVLKKKRNKRRCHPILFLFVFFNVQASAICSKIFNEYIEYNNLQFLSRGTSKFKEDDGRRDAKSNKKKYVKIDIYNFDPC